MPRADVAARTRALGPSEANKEETMRVGRYFVLGLLAFGVIVGLVLARVPQLQALPVPAFTLPLMLSFAVELALMPLVRHGRVQPLSMAERALGVIGAALIATGILELSR